MPVPVNRRNVGKAACATAPHETVYDIKQTYDGKWMTPTRKHFYRACCDCGLVHREEYRVWKGRIQYRVWRDKAETTLERRRTGRGKKR